MKGVLIEALFEKAVSKKVRAIELSPWTMKKKAISSFHNISRFSPTGILSEYPLPMSKEPRELRRAKASR